MHRDGARETREVGVRRVRREREHREDRTDGDVVEPAAAHDSGGELGEDTLVAGGAGIGGPDRVCAAQQRNAGEEDHEQNDDDGERPLGVLLRGLAEGVDAVRDGLDARHGSASAGENLGQKPEGKHRRADGQVWRLDDRDRMAPGGKGAHRSDDDHEQQRADEEVGGNEEGGAGVLDPAHIDQGEDEQDGEAERERVGF